MSWVLAISTIVGVTRIYIAIACEPHYPNAIDVFKAIVHVLIGTFIGVSIMLSLLVYKAWNTWEWRTIGILIVLECASAYYQFTKGKQNVSPGHLPS